MPATSKAQARYFNWLAHDPAAAKKAGVSKKTAREFAVSGKEYRDLPARKTKNVKAEKRYGGK